MKNINNELLNISKRFNIKQLKKLKLLIIIRLLEKLGKIDNDRIYHFANAFVEKISILDIKNRKELKEYKKAFHLLVVVIKKEYPHIAKNVIRSKWSWVALSSTLGSGPSVSPGVIGAGVLIASGQKYDDGSEKNDK